jgi:hypothetical protein
MSRVAVIASARDKAPSGPQEHRARLTAQCCTEFILSVYVYVVYIMLCCWCPCVHICNGRLMAGGERRGREKYIFELKKMCKLFLFFFQSTFVSCECQSSAVHQRISIIFARLKSSHESLSETLEPRLPDTI